MATRANNFRPQRPNEWVLHEYEIEMMAKLFNRKNGAKEGEAIGLQVSKQFLRMERTGINVYRDAMAKIGVEVE